MILPTLILQGASLVLYLWQNKTVLMNFFTNTIYDKTFLFNYKIIQSLIRMNKLAGHRGGIPLQYRDIPFQ